MSSPNTDLSKLGRVNPGDDIRGVARAERIMGLQNITKSHVNGEPYSPSGNLNRIIGPGWVIHRRRRIRTFPGGAGTSLRKPFQIISRIDPNTGSLQLGVIQDSHLFNSEDRNQYEEPNDSWGLLDNDEERGWFNVTESDIGKKFWLQIELDESDQSIVNIDLLYNFPGSGLWDVFPDPIEIDTEFDPPGQQFYHQIIGEISNPDIDPREGSMILTIPGSTTKIQVNQLLEDNIFMTTGRTTHDADQPDIPLLVNASTYGPATDTGGTGTPFPPSGDISTPWQFGTVEAENHYDFEIVNASDQDGAKVFIYDGVVIGPNDDPIDPAGMGNNDFILPIDTVDGNGDAEIWVGVQWDLEADDGVSGDNIVDDGSGVWIATGDTTPDDEGLIQYITIGHVHVDFNEPESINVVTPYNEVCGDIEIPYPPSLLPEEDPETLQLSVDKDTGDVVWKTSKIAQVTAEDTAFDGESGEVVLPDIDVLTFDSNDFSVWDGMGGQAVITVNGDNALQVHGSDGSTVTGVNEITFAVASDPSAGFIHVTDDGGGNAIVEIPILPTTGGGIQVLGSDDGDVQWFGTDQCSS